MAADVIRVDSVSKRYGAALALKSVSLVVRSGEILAVVGPNGAGKTTLIEIMEGLRRPTSGTVRVMSVDPYARRADVAERIGVQLQEGGLNPRLTVGEVFLLFSSLFRRSEPLHKLLEYSGLTEHLGKTIRHLSGGQKQRLALALALVNDPDIVFLDELTTGLDPQARREMWGLVSGLRSRGKTVVFVTHYMEEAEYLGDRVVMIDRGRILALDSPANLIQTTSPGQKIVVDPWEGSFEPDGELPVYRVEQHRGRLYLYTQSPDAVWERVSEHLARSGSTRAMLRVEKTDLEDAYIALVRKEAP